MNGKVSNIVHSIHILLNSSTYIYVCMVRFQLNFPNVNCLSSTVNQTYSQNSVISI